MRVREKNDLKTWIEYFLVGIIETTESSIYTLQQIVRLRDRIELSQLIQLGKRQQDAKKLVNELYKNPIVDGARVAETPGVHASTANRLIKDLMEMGILEELTGYKRNRIYAFGEYIRLFNT